MTKFFYMGGPEWMAGLTILLIITVAWIIYHFIGAYNSKHLKPDKWLRKLSYGKTMGLFSMIVGCLGQLIGLSNMFNAIETALTSGEEIKPELIYGAIKVTMIVTIYGILIYLFSILLWFIASFIIEKKLENQSN